jgi:AcrR family transcriptional regulator
MPGSDKGYSSVWARPRREERSALSREQIVDQALQLLDTEGIEALTMRKLAARLGTTAAALYWHVANRDELIELVVNELYGELELPDAETTDWREATRLFAGSVRAAVLRHRWTPSVLDHLAASNPGPNLKSVSERMLAVFENAGFALPDAERVLGTVSSYVLGMALSEAAWRNWLDRRGQTEQEWAEEAWGATEELTEEHERLRTVMASYEGKDLQQVSDHDFAWGLDRLIDGLQAHLDPRRGR